jgi:hypothetical protein
MKCSSGKLSFTTERLAWLQVISLEKKNTHMGDVYQCPECRQWHMTSLDSTPPAWVTREIVKYKNHKILMDRQKAQKHTKQSVTDTDKSKAAKLHLETREKIAVVAEMNKNIKRSLWRRLKMKLI